eukprot:3029186-Rhodomonas_salina.2
MCWVECDPLSHEYDDGNDGISGGSGGDEVQDEDEDENEDGNEDEDEDEDVTVVMMMIPPSRVVGPCRHRDSTSVILTNPNVMCEYATTGSTYLCDDFFRVQPPGLHGVLSGVSKPVSATFDSEPDLASRTLGMLHVSASMQTCSSQTSTRFVNPEQGTLDSEP